jgi:serine protease Do
LISVEQLNHTYHGLVAKDVKIGATRKLIVESVQTDSPAAKAGLKNGDVILKVADREIVDGVDWERACLDRKMDEPLAVVVKRGEGMENMQLALAPYTGGRSRLQPQNEFVARANNDNTESERFWRVLGVRVTVLPSDKAGVVPAKYRGGLVITEVRPQSPAALNGIKKDDILVGLRDWETLSVDNITWILNQPMTAGQSGMKFLVIRGQETLYGHMQVAGLETKATTTR